MAELHGLYMNGGDPITTYVDKSWDDPPSKLAFYFDRPIFCNQRNLSASHLQCFPQLFISIVHLIPQYVIGETDEVSNLSDTICSNEMIQ